VSGATITAAARAAALAHHDSLRLLQRFVARVSDAENAPLINGRGDWRRLNVERRSRDRNEAACCIGELVARAAI
jgi:hypothetical protein